MTISKSIGYGVSLEGTRQKFQIVRTGAASLGAVGVDVVEAETDGVVGVGLDGAYAAAGSAGAFVSCARAGANPLQSMAMLNAARRSLPHLRSRLTAKYDEQLNNSTLGQSAGWRTA